MFSALKKHHRPSGRIGLSYSKDQLAIAHVDSLGSERPQLRGLKLATAVGTAEARQILASWIDERGLQGCSVAAVLDRSDYEVALVEAPEVQPQELREAVRWRMRGAVEMQIDDAVIDVFPMPKRVSGASAPSVYAVAARRSAVERITAAADVRDMLDAIDIPELVLRNLVHLAAPEPRGCVALVLERSHAHVAVTALGTLYLLRRFELQKPLSAENGLDIDVPGLTLEMQRSLDYYESHFDRPAPLELIVVPRTARAQLLARTLASETSLRIRVLDINDALLVAEPLTDEQQVAGMLAIGAALRVAGHAS